MSDDLDQARPMQASEYELDMESIEDVRGRGGSTQYQVRLAGCSSLVWLKPSQIDRPDLIRCYHQRKNRERRAEIRRKKRLERGQTNSIHDYFKPLAGSTDGQAPSSRLTASQPIRLSECSLTDYNLNRAPGEVASSSQNVYDPQGPALLYTPAPFWSPKELELLNCNDLSTREHDAESKQAAPPHETTSPLPSPPLSPPSPDANGQPAVAIPSGANVESDPPNHCTICQKGHLASEQYLASVCGHMSMCNDCTCSLFINLLQQRCLVCNTVTMFFLTLFDAIKVLAGQLLESGQPAPAAASGEDQRQQPKQRARAARQRSAAASAPTHLRLPTQTNHSGACSQQQA